MKKNVLIFIMLCLAHMLDAQVPQITGFWQCTSGKTFQIEAYNLGFRYKVTDYSDIYQASFIGSNFGVATFRSDFNDGSFSLFMIKPDGVIVTSNSNNPNTLYTWTRMNGNSGNQYNNQYNANYNGNANQYIPKEPKKCVACNGTGYSNSVTYPPNFGTPTVDEWCSTCKSYRRPHTHKLCYSCGGLGEK